MRRALGILALAAWVAGCGSAASTRSSTSSGGSGQPRGSVCGPGTAATLAGGPAARVYAIGGVVYGCAAHGGRSYKLGARTTCLRAPRVQAIAVAGELAAYGLESCGVDTGRASVVVIRLSDGKRLRLLSATRAPLGVESFQLVGSVVVERNGAFAWIGLASSVVTRGTHVEVLRADRRGLALLDSGPGIQPRSLALHGSTLTWRDGGAARTATLQS